ncbi:YcgN family cysteine cluster protein [Ghiorsea bivora]|uniref:YcgN family cysteine cluster protein n=1 Tax=Ghiorsea bivora TaxID=1485545 RepID=UPI000570248D|nr:YcgN family cysteine cluster protein [Ghiorsea bivora]
MSTSVQTTWHEHINEADWEALCDGCGKCCMHKFEDEDTGEILRTNVACKLFEASTCRCTQYKERFSQVPECLDIRKLTDIEMLWLPETCAYRLTFEGKPLPQWHPLNSGDARSVNKAGHSMSGLSISEVDVPEDEIVDYILTS